LRSTIIVLLLAFAAFAPVPLAAAQFEPAKYYKLGGKETLSLQVITADFNNDGILDLAVADALSNKVSVVLGKRDGTFGSPIIFQAGYPINISSGDMNNDGNQDLIVSESGGTGNGYIAIYLGDGTGHFKLFNSYEAGIATGQNVAADLNGDGNLDVAVTNTGNDGSGESMMVFFGNGTGALGKPVSYPFKLRDGGPSAIAAGDLTGDGHIDLVLGVLTFSKTNPSFVAIFLNDGTGKFKLASKYPAGALDIVLADLNGDGKLDIALAGEVGLGILLNKGGGKFGKEAVYPTCKGCGILETLTVADFNLDGNLDVVVTGNEAESIFYGKGNGKFKPAVPINNFSGVWVTSGDFGQDGSPDLAISTDGNKVAVMLNKK
jgi:VCBS repeat protein